MCHPAFTETAHLVARARVCDSQAAQRYRVTPREFPAAAVRSDWVHSPHVMQCSSAPPPVQGIRDHLHAQHSTAESERSIYTERCKFNSSYHIPFIGLIVTVRDRFCLPSSTFSHGRPVLGLDDELELGQRTLPRQDCKRHNTCRGDVSCRGLRWYNG